MATSRVINLQKRLKKFTKILNLIALFIAISFGVFSLGLFSMKETAGSVLLTLTVVGLVVVGGIFLGLVKSYFQTQYLVKALEKEIKKEEYTWE